MPLQRVLRDRSRGTMTRTMVWVHMIDAWRNGHVRRDREKYLKNTYPRGQLPGCRIPGAPEINSGNVRRAGSGLTPQIRSGHTSLEHDEIWCLLPTHHAAESSFVVIQLRLLFEGTALGWGAFLALVL